MNPPSEPFPDSTHAEQGMPEKEARGGVKADDGGIRASDEHVLESPPACPFQSGVYVCARERVFVRAYMLTSGAGQEETVNSKISSVKRTPLFSSFSGPRQ